MSVLYYPLWMQCIRPLPLQHGSAPSYIDWLQTHLVPDTTDALLLFKLLIGSSFIRSIDCCDVSETPKYVATHQQL